MQDSTPNFEEFQIKQKWTPIYFEFSAKNELLKTPSEFYINKFRIHKVLVKGTENFQVRRGGPSAPPTTDLYSSSLHPGSRRILLGPSGTTGCHDLTQLMHGTLAKNEEKLPAPPYLSWCRNWNFLVDFREVCRITYAQTLKLTALTIIKVKLNERNVNELPWS